jgi:hypothetical protein
MLYPSEMISLLKYWVTLNEKVGGDLLHQW